MSELGFFVEHDPEGRPYLGMTVQGQGMQFSMVLCYKEQADQLLSGLNKSVNDLKQAQQKLMVVKGDLNGIRVPQQ